LRIRRSRAINFESLRRLGAVLKRARYFIICNGAFIERPENPVRIAEFFPTLTAPVCSCPCLNFENKL